MIKFVVRKENTGEIVKTGNCQQGDLGIQAGPGEVAEEITKSVNDVDHYFDGTDYVKRPVLVLQHPTPRFTIGEPFRIDGIPPGTLVEHPEGSLQVDDGFLEWSSLEPGVYRFHFHSFPYKPKKIIAEVTAP